MTTPRPLDLLDPRLRPLCDAILGATHVPGASVAIVARDTGYQHAYGVKTIARTDRVTPDTAFNIGSCSKAFASATVAALAADGLVNWDDPVSPWVPELVLHDPALTAQVTFRDLAANRLGLARAGLPESGLDPRFTAQDLFARLRYTPQAVPFRDRFSYFNAGHTANSVAAGRITGKGFLATLRERILAPLGMTGTSGGAATPSELSDLAGWHVVLDGRPVAVDAIFTDQCLAAGGMAVSGRDAIQWLRLHLNGGLVEGQQVIAGNALLETHRPQVVGTPGKHLTNAFYPDARIAAYALGWGVSDLEGHPLLAHFGSDIGVTAMTLLLPKAGIGVAVYANSNGGGPGAIALAYALAATLLGLAPKDWLAYWQAPARPPQDVTQSLAISVAEPTSYDGRYEHPADGPLDICREGGGLVGTLRDAYRMRFALEPAGRHRFEVHPDAIEREAAVRGDRPMLTFTVEHGRAVRAELSGIFAGRPFIRKDP